MATTAMEVLRNLKTKYPQLLLLYGEEDILIDEIVKRYIEEFEVDQFNYTRVDVDKIDADDLEQLIYSPPLFAKARVVVFDNFDQAFSNKQLQEEFINVLEEISKTLTKIILISESSPDRRLKLYKRINNIGIVAESKQLSMNEQYQWLRRELKRRDIFMSNEVEQEFLLQVGSSLRDLTSELDKVSSYKADSNKVVSLEEVRMVVSPSVEASIFRCVDALGQLNIREAMIELELLWTANEPPLRVLAMIIRQMRLLYQIKLLLEQRSSNEKMRKDLGVPNFVLKKLQNQSYNFSLNGLKNQLKSLRKLEEMIKTGKMQPKYAIELWVLGYK
ncbi:MAG: DNA polymerase III subunit delta [Clostridia bacterium]